MSIFPKICNTGYVMNYQYDMMPATSYLMSLHFLMLPSFDSMGILINGAAIAFQYLVSFGGIELGVST